jgi:DNA-binding CsgD family transcriptional regulator
MSRFLGVTADEMDVAGGWLAGIGARPKVGRPAAPRESRDVLLRQNLRAMPFLGFETDEEARRAEEAFLSLSGREATVLAYLAYGHSAKEVAHKLNLSCRTVDTFRTRALLKLRAKNTADAVRMLASLSAQAGLSRVPEAAE